MFITGK